MDVISDKLLYKVVYDGDSTSHRRVLAKSSAGRHAHQRPPSVDHAQLGRVGKESEVGTYVVSSFDLPCTMHCDLTTGNIYWENSINDSFPWIGKVGVRIHFGPNELLE